MIPQHSLAITRSERFGVDDEEVLEMEWLIDEIGEHGPASTPEQAQERPAPEFEVAAERACGD